MNPCGLKLHVSATSNLDGPTKTFFATCELAEEPVLFLSPV
jgi:hypothetical protein